LQAIDQPSPPPEPTGRAGAEGARSDAPRESDAPFRIAFAEAPLGIALAGIERGELGPIIEVNRAVCELTGRSESELVGKHLSEITHPADQDQSRVLVDRLLRGEIPRYTQAKRYLHRDGRTVWGQLDVSLVRDEAGEPRHAIATVRDISDHKQAEGQIAEAQRQLAEAQRLAEIGSWEWRIDTGEVTWSDHFYRLLGLDASAGDASYDGFYGHVHPEDREHVRRLTEECLSERKPFKMDFRMIRADGAVRLMASRAEVVLDDEGRPVKMRGTAQDVTERRHFERELALGEEATREHTARSEFLSRISHELRTPLNAILGFAQLLEMDALEKSQRDNVAQIRKGGQHLLELINEVLEISRIQSGNLSVSLEPVHVGSAVAEVLDLVEPLAAEHEVSLENQLEPEDAGRYVQADLQRLKQVLLNLLSNGIKYNRQGGAVRVSLESVSPERVLILVTDTGRGIPEDKLAKVFSPFDRLGAERSTIEGTGLGLTLSKLLVEAMGGTLGVESEPWIGSSFIIGLAPAEAPLAGPELDRALEPVPVTEASSTTASVLYVEDNVSNLKLAEQILRKRPEIKLLAALDGGLALELARQHHPELILLDLHLPGLPGEEVLRQLKDDPATFEIPVVAVSADATSERVEAVLAAGAEAFLTKPLDVSRFLSVIDEALRERVGA
jgi:PAS domain S-box-containing protein